MTRTLLGLGLCLSGAVWAAEGPLICPPAEGSLLTLRRNFRAPAEGVVILFSAHSNEAEFRGCEDQACLLRIHRKTYQDGVWRSQPVAERGMGQLLEVPLARLPELVVLAPCPEVTEVKKPVRRRPKRARKKPTRHKKPPKKAPSPTEETAEAPTEAEAPAAPASVGALIDSGGYGTLQVEGARPQKLSAFPALVQGKSMRIDNRVSVTVAPEGRLDFNAKTASVDPKTMAASGEGLNALDGIDINLPMKRAYAAATYDARFEMYLEHRSQTVRESLQVLLQTLEAIRSDTSTDKTAQLAAIRALHSQPLDETLPAVNEAFATGAEQARALIEAFAFEHYGARL